MDTYGNNTVQFRVTQKNIGKIVKMLHRNVLPTPLRALVLQGLHTAAR
jgi:hypothetical protein